MRSLCVLRDSRLFVLEMLHHASASKRCHPENSCASRGIARGNNRSYGPICGQHLVRAVKDARLPVQSHPDQSDRLFMRHPRLSFARKQAERDWQQISPVSAAPVIDVTAARPPTSRLAGHRGTS